MKTTKLSFFPLLFGCVLAATHSNLQAAASQGKEPAGLQSATVTEVKNELTILGKDGTAKRAATVKDIVKGDVLRTGKESRAELVFKDHSVVRLGANTIFRFDPASRNMWVQKGTAVIHVPPGLGGASIHTSDSTTKILGDTVAVTTTATATQVAVLSKDPGGPVTVTSTRTGVIQPVNAGQIMAVSPTGSTKPMNFSVDVMMQTSGLLAHGFSAALPATAQNEIQQTQLAQNKQIQNGNLGFSERLVNIGDTINTVNLTGPNNNNSVVQDRIALAAVTPTAVIPAAVTPTAVSPFAGIYNGRASIMNTATLTIQPNGSFNFTSTGMQMLSANISGNINSNGSIGTGDGSMSSVTAQNPITTSAPNNNTYVGSYLTMMEGADRFFVRK